MHSWLRTCLSVFLFLTSYLCYVYRGTMAVIQPDPLEDLDCLQRVLEHVVPEIGAVLTGFPKPQLHAVSPHNQLTSNVDVRTLEKSYKMTFKPSFLSVVQTSLYISDIFV